ncbi:Crp/Fnr family transcriptional regulator [Sandaracinus amylolyticus]|uniref:Crp/Fnr family transcriptional regulator n=1 Tax=Sandaracinus amylolyticus TaxID=927083 RepID=UPI001F21BFAE|nr:Crp/Fnr family transcriptional regulator [Sandaracinus amylolyticus]
MAIAPRSADELFRDVPILGQLPAPDLHLLAEAAEVRKVARAAPLFSEGQAAEGLFVVRTGEVKLTKSGRDGREQIIYLARPGRPIIEGVRFDGGVYPASAIAMRAGSALLVSNETIASLGEKRPAILRVMLDLRAHRADKTLRLVSDLSLRTVPARLASFLCTLAAARELRGEDSRHLVRDLTTETVAGRLGTVREEISRGLALLEREGALKVTPDLIEVLDIAKLESIAYGRKKGS